MDKQEGEDAMNKDMEMLKESIYKEFLNNSGLTEESLGENDKKRLQALSAIAAKHISILEESLSNISANRMNLKMLSEDPLSPVSRRTMYNSPLLKRFAEYVEKRYNARADAIRNDSERLKNLQAEVELLYRRDDREEELKVIIGKYQARIKVLEKMVKDLSEKTQESSLPEDNIDIKFPSHI